MHLLVTRPYEDGVSLIQKLKTKGYQVSYMPIMNIIYHAPVFIPSASSYVFTSANAVRGFQKSCSQERLRAIISEKIMAYAVGSATAKMCELVGFHKMIVGDGDVENLTELIVENPPPSKKQYDIPLLHIAGRHRAGHLIRQLRRANIHVERIVLYHGEPLSALPIDIKKMLSIGQIDTVIFYSQRSASIFIALLKQANLEKIVWELRAICLSESIAEILRIAHFKWIGVAQKPNEESLLEMVSSIG